MIPTLGAHVRVVIKVEYYDVNVFKLFQLKKAEHSCENQQVCSGATVASIEGYFKNKIHDIYEEKDD